jgi:hypothetical protein
MPGVGHPPGMELQNRDLDLFVNIKRVENVYPMAIGVVPLKAGLAAWTNIGEGGRGPDSRGVITMSPTSGIGCYSKRR